MIGKVNEAFRYWVSVRLGTGLPATGIAPGNFSVTVRNPQDTASSNPAVTEVSGGLYYFDIPAAFTNTHGAGPYGVNVAVNSASPSVQDTGGGIVNFYAADLDDLSQPGDAMDLVADAVDASAVATSGAQEIRDEILSDSTPFPGANVDAAISSRSSHSAADVWTNPTRTLSSFGTLVADIWSYSTRTLTAFSAALALGIWDVLESAIVAVGSIGLKVKTNLDTTVSSRSSHTPANVDTQLSGTHGAGSWESATERDWTDGERNQIRDALGVDGTKVAATGGQLQDKAEPGDDMGLTVAAIDAVRLEIMSYIVNGNSLSLTFEETVDLIRKAARNRLEQADGSSGNLILYDDDNTPLITWNVVTKNDGAIDQPAAAPAKRSAGVITL